MMSKNTANRKDRRTLANRILDNLVNGNLSDAKRLARNIGFRRLRAAARERWPQGEADAAAQYCKGYCTFDEYCEGGNDAASGGEK